MGHSDMTDATKPANELCPYFELSSSLRYRTLQWSDTNDRLGLHVIRLFRSLSPIPDWRPPILRPTTYEETINAEEESETAIERFENGFGDSPNYTSCFLLFSQSAVEKCRTILERSGELLPVEVIDVETKYFAFHCLTQIDAIDLSASTVERFKHDGSIRRFLCAAWRDDTPDTSGLLFRLNIRDQYQIFADRMTAAEINTAISGIELRSADDALAFRTK